MNFVRVFALLLFSFYFSFSFSRVLLNVPETHHYRSLTNLPSSECQFNHICFASGVAFTPLKQHLTENVQENHKTLLIEMIQEYSHVVTNKLKFWMGGYIPYNAIIVRNTPESRVIIQELRDKMRWIAPFPNHLAFKSSAGLLNLMEDRHHLSVSISLHLEMGFTSEEVRDLLYSNFGSSINLFVRSRDRIDIDIIGNFSTMVYNLIHKIAELQEVGFISQKLNPKLVNHWSKIILQNTDGIVPSFYDPNAVLSKKFNLTGKGEVVASMDSGIDMTSCYFYDNNYVNTHNGKLAPFVDITSTLKTPFPPSADDLTHRKVIQYVHTGDNIDNSFGHGTHTQGAIAGKSAVLDDISQGIEHSLFDGIASDAKLAFFDMVDAAGNLIIPTDLEKDVFQWGYLAGARIHSNSWGNDGIDNSYGDDSIRVDRFMHNHPDFLVIFASGNDGANGFRSVSVPATNKNGLTIGASEASNPDYVEAYCGATSPFVPYLPFNPYECTNVRADSKYYNDQNIAYFSSTGPTADNRIKPDAVTIGSPVVSAFSDSDSNNNCNRPTTQVVKTMSGTSMATPIAAGHCALIRQYFREGWYPFGVAKSSIPILPSAALVKILVIHGSGILTGVQDIGCCRNKNADNGKCCDVGSGSPSHSTRPNLLTVPNKQQGYGRLQLVKSLYFPRQDKNDFSVPIYILGHSFTATCFPESIVVTIGLNLAVNPVYISVLQNSDSNIRLPLNYEYSSFGDPLFSSSSVDGFSHEYAVCSTSFELPIVSSTPSSTPFLHVSLGWTDYPGSISSAHALVNDLDLILVLNEFRSDFTKYFYGNGDLTGNTRDSNNNVEKVIIPLTMFVPNSVYLIRVSSINLPVSPQAYSLVVSGAVYPATRTFSGNSFSYSCNSAILNPQNEMFPAPFGSNFNKSGMITSTGTGEIGSGTGSTKSDVASETSAYTSFLSFSATSTASETNSGAQISTDTGTGILTSTSSSTSSGSVSDSMLTATLTSYSGDFFSSLDSALFTTIPFISSTGVSSPNPTEDPYPSPSTTYSFASTNVVTILPIPADFYLSMVISNPGANSVWYTNFDETVSLTLSIGGKLDLNSLQCEFTSGYCVPSKFVFISLSFWGAISMSNVLVENCILQAELYELSCKIFPILAPGVYNLSVFLTLPFINGSSLSVFSFSKVNVINPPKDYSYITMLSLIVCLIFIVIIVLFAIFYCQRNQFCFNNASDVDPIAPISTAHASIYNVFSFWSPSTWFSLNHDYIVTESRELKDIDSTFTIGEDDLVDDDDKDIDGENGILEHRHERVPSSDITDTTTMLDHSEKSVEDGI